MGQFSPKILRTLSPLFQIYGHFGLFFPIFSNLRTWKQNILHLRTPKSQGVRKAKQNILLNLRTKMSVNGSFFPICPKTKMGFYGGFTPENDEKQQKTGSFTVYLRPYSPFSHFPKLYLRVNENSTLSMCNFYKLLNGIKKWGKVSVKP